MWLLVKVLQLTGSLPANLACTVPTTSKEPLWKVQKPSLELNALFHVPHPHHVPGFHELGRDVRASYLIAKRKRKTDGGAV